MENTLFAHAGRAATVVAISAGTALGGGAALAATLAAAPEAPTSVSAPRQTPCTGLREMYGWHFGSWWKSGNYCYWSRVWTGWFQYQGRWKYGAHDGWVYGSYYVLA